MVDIPLNQTKQICYNNNNNPESILKNKMHKILRDL